jgi:hypothetical protein
VDIIQDIEIIFDCDRFADRSDAAAHLVASKRPLLWLNSSRSRYVST